MVQYLHMVEDNYGILTMPKEVKPQAIESRVEKRKALTIDDTDEEDAKE